MSTICISSDCRYVQNPEWIGDVPVPAPTDSWRPVAHGDVRDELIEGMNRRGMTVINERWALSTNRGDASDRPTRPADGTYTGPGSRVFGLLEFANGDDANLAIGVRNSYDKTLALGIAVGASVFICDNLMLNGDAVQYRKHTSGIDLAVETTQALEKIGPAFGDFSRLMSAMKAEPVTDLDFDSIVCNSIRAGVMPGTSARNVLRAWHDREAPLPFTLRNDNGFADRLRGGVYDERTAWSAHNLITDVVFKRWSLTGYGNDMIERSRNLRDAFAKQCPALAN